MNFSLEELQTMNDEELKKAVLTRAHILEEQSQEQKKIIIENERAYEYGSYYDGFIKKDVKISSSLGSNLESGYYVLDSDDYLVEFFKYLQQEKVSNKQQAILRIASFLDMYFGEFDDNDRREINAIKTGNHCLSSLKGQRIAACTERAALTNNILRMLGFRSIYVNGSVKVRNGNEIIDSLHCYNIMQNSRGDYLIVDSTSKCGVYDEQNHSLPLSATYYISLKDPIIFLTQESSDTIPLTVKDAYAIKKANGEIQLRANGDVKSYGIEALPRDIVEEKNKTHI